MGLFFIILAILGVITLFMQYLKKRDEQKRQDSISQAKQRETERMNKLRLDYESKHQSIERGEDFYTTTDGLIKVKRSYLDANFLRGAIMSEDIFFAKEDFDGYVTLTQDQFSDLHIRKQEYEQRNSD